MELSNLAVYHVELLFTYAKAWRMAVVQYARSVADSTIKMDIKNVREPEPLSSQAVTSDVMRLSSIESLNCMLSEITSTQSNGA